MSARSGEQLCAAALALSPQPARRRAALFLARQAMEEAIRARAASVVQAEPPRSMRSCLLLLKSGLAEGVSVDTAMRARRSWHSLSARCHHQPYELVPTAEECESEILAAAALVHQLWPQ